MRHIHLACLTAAALTVAACSGGGSSGSTASANDTLTLVSLAPPVSLDPAKSNVDPFSAWTVNLPYDSLIRIGPNGSFEPDLATSWRYVGAGNKVFELTLREGVKFADGSPLTAEAVVGSLNYFREKGLNSAWISAIKSVTAKDPRTVRIECATANPELPRLLSQSMQIGSVISPAGLADPAKLGTQTFGAGPYMLDPKQTVAGDHYTMVPNPHYWDKTKVHWKRVVVKVIANPNSALQAMRTGQGDILGIDPQSVATAKAASLTIVRAPGGILGLNLMDRAGVVDKPLKDVRVRKALNHAVDRARIMKAIYLEFGHPSAQLNIPGSDSYSEALDNAYPYDVEKARRLLAEAGYPDGFSLNIQTTNFFGMNLITQAVLEQWKKIGVTGKVTTDTTPGQWIEHIMSRKFSTAAFGYGGGLPLYVQSLDWLIPRPTTFNPFAINDGEIVSGLAKANAAAPEARPAQYQAIMKLAVDKAWFVAVGRTDGNYAISKRITGLNPDPKFLGDVAWSVRAAK